MRDELITEEEKIKHLNWIKSLEFSDDIYTWYLLSNKNPNDKLLYQNILTFNDLKKQYKKVIKNVKKNGNKDMPHEELVNIYLSKKFNHDVLLPLIKQQAKLKKINLYR